MRSCTRMISLLLCIFMMMSLFAVFPTYAADKGVDGDLRYTQKVVSVLYDNSGSMIGEKNQYALYSLQMLMALLSKDDVLTITPMNNNSQVVTSTSAGIEVNLSAANRDSEIKRVLNSSFLSKSPAGKTPGSAIAIAVDQLEERGLKNRDNLWAASDDKEYWLVILTDGAFDEQVAGSINADDIVESHIKDFPSLKTIYLGFGADSPNLSGSSLISKYPFTPYRAVSTDDIVDAMQSVANQLSGSYTLDSSCYSVSGKTVTVDLSKYEFSFKNISVIAQDCGATLKSATYNSSSMKIEQACVIVPTGLSNIQNGYSAVVPGDPYLSGGKLVMEFSAPVDIDDLSILAEPALTIVPYLEYKNKGNWERTTMQYVNANLSKGDDIRVGYEVFELAKGDKVDLEKIFGKSEAKVTYAGGTYNVNSPIPLSIGNNDINVTVSVMDGAYRLSTSMICIIEATPTNYRVEAKYDDTVDSDSKTATAVYTIYIDGKPVTSSSALSSYTYEVYATSPDGSKIDVEHSLGADGKVTAKLKVNKGACGKYEMYFKITSEYNLSREYKHTVDYPLTAAELLGSNPTLTPIGEGFTLSQYALTSNELPISFELKADNNPLVFDNGFTEYEVTLDGNDITKHTTVEGNVLTYVPLAKHYDSMLAPGEHTVKIRVFAKSLSEFSLVATQTFNVTETLFVVQSLDFGNKTADRFDLDGVETALYFKVTHDGVALTVEELQSAIESGEISIKDEKGVFGWQFWLPCGKEITAETVNGESVIVYKVDRDWIKPFYTFAAMLIFNGDKPITVSYYEAVETDSINFAPSSAWDYIWRILVIIFTIYVIFYLIGFFNGKCKSLSPGAVIVAWPSSNSSVEETFTVAMQVNLTFWERYSWHLWRFIPHSKHLWYHQPSKRCMMANGLTYGFNATGVEKISFNNDELFAVPFNDNGTEAAVEIKKYKSLVRKMKAGKKPIMNKGIVRDDYEMVFKRAAGTANIQANTWVGTGSAYGTFDNEEHLNSIVWFVKHQ